MASFRLSRFRLIPRFENHAGFVRFCSTPLGKLFLLALFAVMLFFNQQSYWIYTAPILAAASFFPRQRRPIAIIGTIYWIFTNARLNWPLVSRVAYQEGTVAFFNSPNLFPNVMAAVLIFCAGFYYLASRQGSGFLNRRPVAVVLALLFTFVAFALGAPLSPVARTFVWAFVIVLARYIWFFCYSLNDINAKNQPPFYIQFGFYLPFWTLTAVPFPKGYSYLSKVEVKDANELAVVQIKAVKLLLWSTILWGLYNLLLHYGYGPGEYRILHLNEALAQHRSGVDHPVSTVWLCVSGHYLIKILDLCVFGHRTIAICRMAGFNALRNTYKPFLSQSIAEFWNRLYYYFKELLVEMFFYPTFLRWFKGRPKIRLFFATFMAACVGNIIFHLVAELRVIVMIGWWEALKSFHVYVIYSFILGVGIALSQLRKRPAKPRFSLLAALAVTAFFGVISVLDVADSTMDVDRTLTIRDYASFMLCLAGIRIR